MVREGGCLRVTTPEKAMQWFEAESFVDLHRRSSEVEGLSAGVCPD